MLFSRILIAVLPAIFTPSCFLGLEIRESPDNSYIQDATVTACIFLRRARTTPLSEQHYVLFPSNSGFLLLFSQRGAGAARMGVV